MVSFLFVLAGIVAGFIGGYLTGYTRATKGYPKYPRPGEP